MCTLRHIVRHTAPDLLRCAVCNKAVELEVSKTDEDGHAVHEDCYLAKLSGKIPPKPQRASKK